MKKYIMAGLITALIYIVPLIGAPFRLLDPRLLVVMSGCCVLLLTQPELKPAEVKDKSRTDRYSVLWIVLAALACQVFAVVEWGYGALANIAHFGWPWTIAGMVLLSAGLAFRVWAIRVLDRCFTTVVTITPDHTLITAGPYEYMRHPSYLGAYISMIGGALVLGAIASAIASAVIMFAVYRYRIKVEEAALDVHFGNEYALYCARTWKMAPLIW